MYTPRRRKLTHILVKGKPQSLVNQVMKDPRYLTLLLTKVGMLIKQEISTLCSDNVYSVFSNIESLSSFSWEKVMQEAEKYAPSFLKILLTALWKEKESNCVHHIAGLVLSIFCCFRRRSRNTVQRIISIILYAGHCSKQVNVHACCLS